MYYADHTSKLKKVDRAYLKRQRTNHADQNRNLLPHVTFAAAYVAFLIIVGILYGVNYENPQYNLLFNSWQQFSAYNVIKLIAAIALSFFFPGYAIINVILDKTRQDLRLLPKILLGYILSLGIVGFLGYIAALMDFAISDVKLVLIFVNVLILALFLRQLDVIPITTSGFFRSRKNRFSPAEILPKFSQSLPEVIVFGSLLALVVLSTYILYNGVMVGDQWFHHGRALQFISGDYKAITTSNSDYLYPPLLSAFLSSFFVLADVPTVNAYASIGFLNVISVFAFYYFLQNWIPTSRKKSALLAATLFVLSSGFGWIFAINTLVDSTGPPSQNSALLSILEVSKQTYDIRSPSTFLLASHPDISTGLQLIVLPIGFVLLGIVKDENVKPKYRSYITVIVMAILLIGIFSHDEIYFFIIVVCIVPIVFGLRGKGFIYLGILLANGIAILANYIFLEDYLSATVIMGIPLIVISFFFIMIAWAIYSSRILDKLYYAISTRIATINKAYFYKNSEPYRSRSKFTLSVILVLVVSYLYLFSYITWADLSVKDVEIQTSEGFPRNVPWYLFPMKLGLIGILGLCFVLSYIFRRFEKEVFVFAVIIIVAIITGPYYDEHRFNKYVMVGLVGFASLFIYDIIVFINKRFHYGILLSGIFVGSVIVLSSLSTLMFVGFQAASIDTDNLDFLWEGRRNFPSPSELQVLQFLRNYTTSNFNSPGVYNIVTWPNEYQLKLGLVGKFEGFLGVPIPKMLQSPLAVNASSLESFYNLLSKSDARFIVVSSPDIVNKDDAPSTDGIRSEKGIEDNKKSMKAVEERKQELRPITDPTDIQDFALVNFDKIYQDGKFVVLSVPSHLTPPSSSGENAMILSGSGEALRDPNNSSVLLTLPYTDKFYKIGDSDFAKVSKDEESLLLNTYNKSQTLWSRDVEYQNGNLDYIEAKFMVIDQNRTKENIECGVIWENEGEKKYYVRIKDDKLEFSETPAPKDRFILENLQVKLNEEVPYNLKLMFSNSTLDVYVDDMRGLQIPSKFYQGGSSSSISRIGVRCSGNTAEFEPIKIAQIGQSGGVELDNSRKKQQDYEYYYPLTMLALSGAGYDTFLRNDNSIFSKDNILMTTRTLDDYYENNDKVSNRGIVDRLLEYVRGGGTLTILNTENPIDGWLREDFSIKSISDKKAEYNRVVEPTAGMSFVNLTGTTTRIGTTSPDVAIKSYYQQDSEKVSPFALVKNYGKGKIILVNAAGYFDAIAQEPEKYFSRLGDIPLLVGIDSDNNSSKNKNKTNTKLAPIPPTYNLGELRITGTSAINGSSLLLPFENENTLNQYFVGDISVLSNNTGGDDIPPLSPTGRDANNNNITVEKSELRGDTTSIARNTLIKNLELQGSYNATLKSEGTIQLPSPTAPYSKSNYVSLSIPSGFDMEISLSNDSSALITLANGTEITVETNGSNNSKVKSGDKYDGVQIYVHNIRDDRAHGNPVSVLMKRPQILADGNATFDSLFQGGDFDLSKGIEGNLYETRNDSRIDLKLDYIDSYYSSSNRKQTEDYVTYIDLLNVDRTSNSATDPLAELRIPGDISDTAKNEGIEVPWEKAFFSVGNAVAIIFFAVAGGLITLIMWPRFRNHINASR